MKENPERARFDIFDNVHNYKGEERRFSGDLMRRIDSQDQMLLEIRDMVVLHIETEKETQQSVKELVLLWRGSKLIMPILIGAISILGGLFLWIKDYIK